MYYHMTGFVRKSHVFVVDVLTEYVRVKTKSFFMCFFLNHALIYSDALIMANPHTLKYSLFHQ